MFSMRFNTHFDKSHRGPPHPLKDAGSSCRWSDRHPQCDGEVPLRSMMRRVEARAFNLMEDILSTYYTCTLFSCNSQIKCFRTHVDMDIFSYFGMWNFRPKFALTVQLHPV
jgi:hypothetical protein